MFRKIGRREFLKVSAATGAVLSMTPKAVFAQEPKVVPLSKPPAGGGRSLMEALGKRQSSRQFSTEPLKVEALSSLLWAGCGINRPDGKRTAPTAMNWQDTDIYAILPDGLYLYDAKASQLKMLFAQDLRGYLGSQAYAKEAPVNLVYVCDYARMGGKTPEETKHLYSGFHAGAMAQNVYLYCASEGLATVVRANIDKAGLTKAMKLRPDQKIVITQSVGYPKAS